MEDFCLFQAASSKNSPAAAKSPISVYFQVVLLISEFLRELNIFCTIFLLITEFLRELNIFISEFLRELFFCTIFSLFPSFFSSVTSRTKLGKIACGGIEDNNIIVPVLQMSCSAWTLVSVRLRIVEVHSQVNQIRKLGNKSGSALSQACAHIYM